LFIRLTLQGGAQGFGEMAPFPEVGGEDRATCRLAAAQLAQCLLGQPATRYRKIARVLQERAPEHPAARCGLETALLDALCRQLGVPLWGFWGGADVRERETDITIPIASLDRTVTLGREWHAKGFRILKTKVGVDVEQDIRRLEALHRALPDIAVVADANQGFTEEACRFFVKEVTRFGGTILLLEQPVSRDNPEGMAALRRDLDIPIAADESVRTLQDARQVVRRQAADVINIKIMKSGVLEGLEIAGFAQAAGLRLMIGGMVETRVAMGCSFGMVLGFGGFDFLDLDTPLLLADDPVSGGFRYAGPTLHPWTGPGLDLKPRTLGSMTVIE
ncbi:MAG: mandelate racemase/muconate lactonizing enzyme family protein, partial [Nitrospirales bacterium]